MDIALLSMAMSQANVKQDASLSVMKMVMDNARANSADMVEMIEQSKALERSVQPYLGGNVDIRV